MKKSLPAQEGKQLLPQKVFAEDFAERLFASAAFLIL